MVALIDKYIKPGTFSTGQSGDSEGEAYQAGNAAEFDRILRDVLILNQDGYHIHLAAGTYFTSGSHYLETGMEFGWDIRSNWTISGAGEGNTIMRLDRWPTFLNSDTGLSSPKWQVIGNPGNARVSNVVIEHLTVDANWSNLPNRPIPTVTNPPWTDQPFVALHCIACFTDGPITCRRITVTGFYGKIDDRPRFTNDVAQLPIANDPAADLSQECFALCAHSATPMDPGELDPARLAVFDHCTVHHWHGDYCVGIASFNGGPSIINGCHFYSLANLHSGAIQAIGKNILITNNIVRDCFLPFYVDTGNIINLVMEGNFFISNGQAVILTNSTNRSVWVNVRASHDASADRNFQGVSVDIPIRPLAGSGANNPLYRIRLWFSNNGLVPDNQAQLTPEQGQLVQCNFNPAQDTSAAYLESRIVETFTNLAGTHYVAASQDTLFSAVRLSPVEGVSEWIYHSQGAPSASKEHMVYIQSGWSWTNWRIRNNYLEVGFRPFGTFAQQYLAYFTGNGSTDKDYHVSGNVARFTGSFDRIQTPGLDVVGIQNITSADNALDSKTGQYGGIRLRTSQLTVESQTDRQYGNRDLHGRPIFDSPDDFHQSGAQQTLASASGLPLPGTIRFSSPASQGIVVATGFDTRNELRPGDLLATDSAGHIGTPQNGPFYVTSIDPDGLHATLSSAGPDSTNDYTVRRYRGPASYLTAAGAPLFLILNDGSLAVRGIPANLGFGEFYFNGKATITGSLRAADGSPAAPGIYFASAPGTGIHRPAAGAVGLAAGGVERVRLTSPSLQLGTSTLAFGATVDVPDTTLQPEAATNTLALRNGLSPQTFRIAETYSGINYARLSLVALPGGSDGNSYVIGTEALGSALRSLQVGSGPRLTTNASGVDTFLHVGQGTGSNPGGALVFMVAATGAGGLQPAWQVGNTGPLVAASSANLIKWGAYYDSPALKAVSTTYPELQVRRGDDTGGAALLHRMGIVAQATGYAIGESETGRCFTNAGANVTVTFTLPDASDASVIGFHCYFVAEESSPIVIHPSAAATIRLGGTVTLAGHDLASSGLGSTIHLVCTQLNTWVALRHIGTWVAT